MVLQFLVRRSLPWPSHHTPSILTEFCETVRGTPPLLMAALTFGLSRSTRSVYSLQTNLNCKSDEYRSGSANSFRCNTRDKCRPRGQYDTKSAMSASCKLTTQTVCDDCPGSQFLTKSGCSGSGCYPTRSSCQDKTPCPSDSYIANLEQQQRSIDYRKTNDNQCAKCPTNSIRDLGEAASQGIRVCKCNYGWRNSQPQNKGDTCKAVCGDGEVAYASETCDVGAKSSPGCQNCKLQGGYHLELASGGQSKVEVAPLCGDGTLVQGEVGGLHLWRLFWYTIAHASQHFSPCPAVTSMFTWFRPSWHVCVRARVHVAGWKWRWALMIMRAHVACSKPPSCATPGTSHLTRNFWNGKKRPAPWGCITKSFAEAWDPTKRKMVAVRHARPKKDGLRALRVQYAKLSLYNIIDSVHACCRG